MTPPARHVPEPIIRTHDYNPTAVWIEHAGQDPWLLDLTDAALAVVLRREIEELSEEVMLADAPDLPGALAQSAMECATVLLRRYRLGASREAHYREALAAAAKAMRADVENRTVDGKSPLVSSLAADAAERALENPPPAPTREGA